jgi:RNA exonuclease 1
MNHQPPTQEVLLDTLVLPSLPVIDYRSDIHGIKPTDLRDVRFTFRHAQAAMLQLCCSETVVVGHGLCNDLTALKMRHHRVVDTALLFEREGAAHHTPALKDVASAVLGCDLPDTHDSVADAQATMKVARHFLEQGPAAPVPRLPGPPGGKKARRGEALAACLLLHRLPAHVTPEHLSAMFHAKTHVLPVSVDPVAVTGGSGRTTARFLSKPHADLAFHTLTGPARPDKDGRPQKRVYLANRKDYVQVRLMYTPGQEGVGEGEVVAVEETATSLVAVGRAAVF